MDSNTLKPGDMVYRWWNAGFEMNPQELRVIRINRKTVTVQTRQGSQFRINPNDIVDFVSW